MLKSGEGPLRLAERPTELETVVQRQAWGCRGGFVFQISVKYGGFLSHRGTPKSSIFMANALIKNHPAIGVLPF